VRLWRVKIDCKRAAFWAVICSVIAAGTAFALIYRPAIAPIAKPDARSFAVDVIQRGAALAAIGDCIVCHTKDAGVPYAGGRPLPTPFGTLYATNITPDEETGIGRWSREAFRRAMREGVSRTGKHRYPALPYEHFTHVDDVDLDALYAFLMTRRAVSGRPPPNRLIFPLGFRPELAGWKLLFLRKGAFVPEPARGEEWNRGAYLVEGLGHCGGCHTPRNLAGGERGSHVFAGGVAEEWNAPSINRSSPAIKPWTANALYNYLRTGIDVDHSAAAGPMGPVCDDLSVVPEADVRAIAAYVASLMNQSATPIVDLAELAAKIRPAGAALFVGACAGCHESGAPMNGQGRPPLSLVSAITEDDPRNTLLAILEGIRPPVGARGAFMPPFADSLADAEVADLAAYLRSRYSNRAAWPKLMNAAATARKQVAP
jgi:mono/diheme cytochrome c family protein